MHKLTIQKTAEQLSKFCLAIIIIGFYYSKALRSIGVVALAILILFQPISLKNYRLLIKEKLFISILVIAVFYMLSFLYGGSFSEYWWHVKNKLLYFFIPVALVNIRFNKKELTYLFVLWIGCALVQSAYAFYAFIEYGNTEKLYVTGQVLPTIKIYHIDISYLICISILLLYAAYKYIADFRLKVLTVITITWFVFFIHLYAVRSGILILYLFFIIQVIMMLKKKKLIPVMLLLILLSVCFYIPYKFSNNIKNRIDYTIYDIEKFKSKDNDMLNYSDSRRLQSILVGIQIIKEHLWLGCGTGNIRNESNKIYRKDYPLMLKENFFKPHSFYIYIICCFGILIGSIILLCFLYPLYYFFKTNNSLLFSLYASLVFISIWEGFMFSLIGECFYLFSVSIGIKMKLNEDIINQQ
ncbi:MAG: O-antigen ligase family protein [Chitinophagales bacterium]